jgi:transposase
MGESGTFVGLDAHKKSIQVAMLLPGQREPVEWEVQNEGGAIRRMVKKLLREGTKDIQLCYEAGVCGFALQRQLQTLGVKCVVIAPSLIPVKPGERIKTDRRDARKLAELFRAGLLTEVHPPTEDEEAVRDLCRAREDAKEDLLRARHRLVKMLLRRGMIWSSGRSAWTDAHWRWLKGLRFDREPDRAVFDDYLLAVEQVQERVKTLEDKLETISSEEPYREPVGWLRCFRGIDTVTAITVVAELHDFSRFTSPRGLMSYLGLVPSEYSSSESRRRGSITKAGNSHVRRVLIEAAWHYRHPPGIGIRLRKRREGQPPRVVAVADKAALRLYRRYYRLTVRGKPVARTIVAIARELVGFIWSLLYPRAVPAA